MGFNNSSLKKKRRIGVKGLLVLAFEALASESDFLTIMLEYEGKARVSFDEVTFLLFVCLGEAD